MLARISAATASLVKLRKKDNRKRLFARIRTDRKAMFGLKCSADDLSRPKRCLVKRLDMEVFYNQLWGNFPVILVFVDVKDHLDTLSRIAVGIDQFMNPLA